MTHPKVLYHSTAVENRESILQNGLLCSCSETAELARNMGEEDVGGYGGIFMSTKIAQHDPEGVEVWAVDVTGIELFPDDTTDWPDPEDPWWVVWHDIPPDRLTLVEPELTAAPAP